MDAKKLCIPNQTENFYIRCALHRQFHNRRKGFGIHFLPYDKSSPLARVSTGDYRKDIEEIDQFSADCNVLASIAHEVTHYFQWLRDDTAEPDERQAQRKAVRIVYQYLDDCPNAVVPGGASVR